MKRGIIAIIMAAAITMYAAESQSLYEQWLGSQEYIEYTRLGGKGSSAAEKLESEFRQKLLDKTLSEFIASYPETYNKEDLKKRIDKLDYSKQYDLADTYTQIKPLLNRTHSPKELSQLNSHIYFYVKSLNDLNGMAVSNLQKLLLIAPELKDTSAFKGLMNDANEYDHIYAVLKDIPSAIEECEMMIERDNIKIMGFKKSNFSDVVKELEEAIKYRKEAIQKLKSNDLSGAKSSYYRARSRERNAEILNLTHQWEEIGEKIQKM